MLDLKKQESEYLGIAGKYVVHELPTSVSISLACTTDE